MTPSTLAALMEAGMDVARLGLAHNTLDEVLERYHRIREVAEEQGRNVGVLVDLPGTQGAPRPTSATHRSS